MTVGRRPNKGTGIPGAEKKLRQAEFFLSHLEYTSHEMVREVARGTENPERLEFFFSACLTAAKSVHYVLKASCLTFKEVQAKWESGLSTDSRARFEWMLDLRDDDVHFAASGATPQRKYVEEDPRQYHYAQPPRALFGDAEIPIFFELNPDGTKVSGVLRGSFGLYLDHQGVCLDATSVCREFIARLRSLLDAVKAAP